MSNSNTIIVLAKLTDNITNWGGSWSSKAYFNDTYYYWNGLNNISNIGNPNIFKYIYNSPTTQSVNIYTICSGYSHFFLNNVYIQTFWEYGTTANNPLLTININSGNNIFEYRSVYLGTTTQMPMFASSVTNSSNTVLFTTGTSGTDVSLNILPNTNWTVDISGSFYNNTAYTDIYYPKPQIERKFEPNFYVSSRLTQNNIDVNLSSMALSTSGKYCIISCNNGPIFNSSDYGVNFIINLSSPTNATWKTIALSGSGQYGIIATTNSNKYISSDYCINWTLISNSIVPTSSLWTSISISSSGQYCMASSPQGIYKSINYGINWTKHTTMLSGTEMAFSSSGQYGILFNSILYYSSDYGVTWISCSGLDNTSCRSLSISNSGQYCIISLGNVSTIGNIYISSNYGINWKILVMRNLISYSPQTWDGWKRVFVSACGQYFFACAIVYVYGGSIEYSTDYGVNWNSKGEINSGKTEISSSATFMIGIQEGSCMVWRSNNFITSSLPTYYNTTDNINYYNLSNIYKRKTWNNIVLPNLNVTSNQPIISLPQFSKRFNTLHPSNMSYNGKYAFSISTGYRYVNGIKQAFGLGIYKSVDYGYSWEQTSAPLDMAWQSISISDSGKYAIACSSYSLNYTKFGYIYYSSDYGTTWQNSSASTAVFSKVVLSKSSKYALESSDYGLFKSSDYGATWTKYTTFGNNLAGDFSISSSGKYGVFCGFINYDILTTAIYNSSDYCATWIRNTSGPTGQAYCISMSDSGKYVILGGGNGAINMGIYKSSDYGNTWTIAKTESTTSYWFSSAISSSGQYSIVSSNWWGGNYGDYTQYSNNYGVTFNKMDTSYSGRVSMSGSGEYIYISNGSTIYSSTNPKMLNCIFSQNFSAPVTNNWKSVKLSDSGQYGIACIESTTGSGAIYYSSDYGAGWTKNVIVSTSNAWSSVAISGSGQYALSGISGSGSIYISSNYCVNWVDVPSITGNWTSSALSSSGQYCIACTGSTTNTNNTNSVIYKSLDYGVTWSINTSTPTNANWSSVALSSSGQYSIAGSNNSTGTGLLYKSSDYGVTWTNVSPITGTWISVALSSSGLFGISSIIGGAVYKSSNYGTTWTINTSAPTNVISVSLSSTGQCGIVCVNNGTIYNSTDYCLNWYINPSVPISSNWKSVSIVSSGEYALACNYDVSYGSIYNTTVKNINLDDTFELFKPDPNLIQSFIKNTSAPTTQNWKSVALSSSGKFSLASIYGDALYNSSDYGVTWIKNTSAPTGNWQSLSVSGSGQYCLASISNGAIYNSSDYGVTWTINISAPTGNWQSLSVSNSGKYCIASIYGDALYNSSDYGVTWTQNISAPQSLNWKSVKLSHSGQYGIASITDGAIYNSSNYGTTWTKNISAPTNINWSSVALSSSGKYGLASVTNGLLYKSSDYGVNWMNVSSITENWTSVAFSSSGEYAFASTTMGIYYSSEYGSIWNINTSTSTVLNWNSVALSSSGQYITACSDGSNGSIYNLNMF